MKGDKEFMDFIDLLLKELGYMNEDGMFEVKQDEIVKPQIKLDTAGLLMPEDEDYPEAE